MSPRLGNAIVATLLGFSLSCIGFSSWDEVHRMFTGAEPRLLLTFGFAVVALAIAWRVVLAVSQLRPAWPRRKVVRGTIAGGVMFGIGWALTGACPAVALVQLGEGRGLAAFSLLGILIGNWLFALVRERYLNWNTGSCNDD